MPVLLALCLIGGQTVPAAAAEMTYGIVNDSGRALSLKFFARDTGRQYPSKSRAYSVQPSSEVQQLKIDCQAGEQVCWGAWASVQEVGGEVRGEGGRQSVNYRYVLGVGDRGMRPCERCCTTCEDGKKVPAFGLRDPAPLAR